MDLQPDAAVEEAAHWLLQDGRHSDARRPVITILKERFGLSTVGACAACTRAAALRREAHHAGG